ncbi:MAG: BlaI/MecI/CopY family transcriptional regulator [Bacteroidia bacterium]
MKELTKAEEELMNVLWKLEKAFLKDIIEAFPEPKPAYTTVSTVLRVLVKKEVVGFNTYSKVHEYFPRIKKKEYFKNHFSRIAKSFFGGSYTSLLSNFTSADNLSITDLEEIKSLIDSEIKKKKK